MDINKIQKQKPILELLEFAIINVDKPAGITSFKTAEKVKKILKARKTGHFGTLDPLVTGVLPVAVNRACKLCNFFMKRDKEYIGKMKLHKEISENDLKKEMEKFVGKIIQKPPKKSRVKRVERERSVSKFDLINYNHGTRTAEFHSDVEAGTYIRKLISDLGEKIGGAHMIELRRIRAGIFQEKDSFTLDEIEEVIMKYEAGNEQALREIIVPAEIISELIPEVPVKKEALFELLNGKPLLEKHIIGTAPGSELISVFCENRFIGIHKISSELKSSEASNIVAKPEFVFN